MTKRLAIFLYIANALPLAACGSAPEDERTPTAVACRLGPDRDSKWARAIRSVFCAEKANGERRIVRGGLRAKLTHKLPDFRVSSLPLFEARAIS
jgi:hypothetical protein